MGIGPLGTHGSLDNAKAYGMGLKTWGLGAWGPSLIHWSLGVLEIAANRHFWIILFVKTLVAQASAHY